MLHGAAGAAGVPALGSWAMAASGSAETAIIARRPCPLARARTRREKSRTARSARSTRAPLPVLRRLLHALPRRVPLARSRRGHRRWRPGRNGRTPRRAPPVHARHPQRAGALRGGGRAHRRVLALHDPPAAAVGVPRGGGLLGLRPAQPPVRPGPDRAWPGAAHRRRLALARRGRQRRRRPPRRQRRTASRAAAAADRGLDPEPVADEGAAERRDPPVVPVRVPAVARSLA